MAEHDHNKKEVIELVSNFVANSGVDTSKYIEGKDLDLVGLMNDPAISDHLTPDFTQALLTIFK